MYFLKKHSAELSKSVKIWLSKSIFNVKNHLTTSDNYFHFTFFILICLMTLIFESLKLCSFTKYNNLSTSTSKLFKSNFESLSWKLDNQYCHKMGERLNIWGHFSIYLQWSSHHDLYKNSSPLWKSDVNSQFHMLPIGSWLKEKFVKM